MSIWKPLIIIAAVFLSAVSVALPAVQWAAIPIDTWAKVLAGVTATALGICKLGFFPLAWLHFQTNKYVPAAALGLFALLFLVINVDATTDLLTTYGEARAKENQSNNSHHKQLTIQLKELNREAETVNGLLAADLANNYRERAYQQRKVLDQIKKQRNSVLAAMESIEVATKNTTSARFGVAAKLPHQNSSARLNGELVASLAIHLGTVLAVLACGVWGVASKPKNLPKHDGKPPQKATTANTQKKEPASQVADREDRPEFLTSEQQKLAAEIKAGVYGNTPSIKDLVQKKVIVGGYKKINPVFALLLANGDLSRGGRGYQLTQLTIS